MTEGGGTGLGAELSEIPTPLLATPAQKSSVIPAPRRGYLAERSTQARPHLPTAQAPHPSFLRRQEPTRAAMSRPTTPDPRRRPDAGWTGRQTNAARTTVGGRLDSCLRRNDGGARV